LKKHTKDSYFKGLKFEDVRKELAWFWHILLNTDQVKKEGMSLKCRKNELVMK